MFYYYGKEGKIATEMWWDQKITMQFMADNYPLTPLALKNAGLRFLLCNGRGL
jgi:hypothetical protein